MQGAIRYLWHALLVAILLAISSAITFGQTSGTLQGVVVDENNKPLPEALVTATNDNNGVPRNTVTNQLGRYQIAFLEPGRYTVSAILDGFEESKIGDIIIPLNVVTPLEVPPIVLRAVVQPGTNPQPTTNVPKPVQAAVTGNSTLVDLTDAANRGNYDSNLLRSLPLGGI